MGFDFRVDSDFFEHPKTERLTSACGRIAALCLLELWAYVARYRSDGRLSEMTDREIEIKAKWDGDPGVFSASLVSLKWLDGAPNQRRIHDWPTHQSWVSKRTVRKQAAKLNAQKRWQNEYANAEALASTIVHAPQNTPASPSKPQNTPASPKNGVSVFEKFITTAAAKTECEAHGWEWPSEQKQKSLSAVESVFPCSREIFDAAVAETAKRNPLHAAAYLAGTVRSMKISGEPRIEPGRAGLPKESKPRCHQVLGFDSDFRIISRDGVPVAEAH